jgi:glycosyltransferase involved in cell wall biosynthesis
VLPDSRVGWTPFAVGAGLNELHRFDTAAILAIDGPLTSLLIGALLARLTGKPLVLNLGDAWTTNPYRQTISAAHARAERSIERFIFRSAAYITVVTERMRDDYLRAYPDLPGDTFVVVPNGFDLDDFAGPAPAPVVRSGPCVFAHVGTVYPQRTPAVPFLRAVRYTMDSSVEARKRLRIRFVGNTNPELQDVVHELRLESCVSIEDYIPYRQSVALMRSAAVLLLLADSYAVTSKSYQYLVAGPPVLAITPVAGEAGRLIRRAGVGRVIDPEDTVAIRSAILAHIAEWQSREVAFEPDCAFTAKFDRRAIAGTVAGLLSDAVRNQQVATQGLMGKRRHQADPSVRLPGGPR